MQGKIGILSSQKGYHTLALERVIRDRGYEPVFFNITRMAGWVSGSPAVQVNGETASDCTALIVRTIPVGSLEQIISMLPGMGQLKQLKALKQDEGELIKIEAIISSMTKEERRNYRIINGSRRKRIALGSGTKVQDVNRLLKNFGQKYSYKKQI